MAKGANGNMRKTVVVSMIALAVFLSVSVAFAGTYDGLFIMVRGDNDGKRCSESVMGHPQFGEQINAAFPAEQPYDTDLVWSAINYEGQLWSTRQVSLDAGQTTTINGYFWAGTFYEGQEINISVISYDYFHPDAYVSNFTVFRPDGSIFTSVPRIGDQGYLRFTAPAVYSTLNTLGVNAYRWQATLNGAPVPEPSSLLVFGSGVMTLSGFGLFRRRK